MPRLENILQTTRQRLRLAGVEDWEFEARELVEAALDLRSVDVVTQRQRQYAEAELAQLESWIARRSAGEPVAYITGRTTFYRGQFLVQPGVLIPRVDTEVLVHTALQTFAPVTAPHILELGVGSGCVLISLLDVLATARGWGTDLSPTCLQVTQQNADKHGVSRRLALSEGSWFEALDQALQGTFDGIISNPPYIPVGEAEALQDEVLHFEPNLALFAGENGFKSFRVILSDARQWLKPGGKLLFEVGFDQARSVADLAVSLGFSAPVLTKDTQGIERVVTVQA